MWLVATVALALLILPWVIALALAPPHHLDATAVGILAAVTIPLSALWLTWVTVAKGGGSGTSSDSLSMSQVADQLAFAVGTLWEAEAKIRRLNDPYPLSVSWAVADPSLTDSWDSLVRLATDGAGWPRPLSRGTWAAGPADLAGEGGELVEVLARVPTGRLVVLGEPGAGKTMLMVRLILDLLARRASGGAVPFLASIASWNPEEQDLRAWLGGQLLIDHPALANPPPVGMTEPTQAAALLASGLILPVLDGLDEIPEQVRGSAISRINDALRPGEQLVVTCRTQQYRNAVRPQGGVEVTSRAAAVQLRPLDAVAVRTYLCDDAAGSASRARWEPVLKVLGTDAPAGQALSTPLMVGLARAIYNPRPGELAGTLRDPAELSSPAPADRSAVESLLFDAFIPAAYRDDPPGRWKAQDAERWLVFLACHLEYTIGSADLAWWQLQDAVPRRAVGLAAGLAVGLAVGLGFGLGLGLGLGFGLGSGLAVGLAAGLVIQRRFGSAKAPARGMRRKRGFGVGLALMLGLGLAGGIAGGFVLGLVLVLGLGFVLVFRLAGVPSDLAGVTSPGTALARDRQVALLPVFVAGLVAGLVFGLGDGLVFGLVFGLGDWLVFGLVAGLVFGLVAGLVAGLGLSMSRTAWPSYMLTRGWLAFHHHLPWSLMSFLADAHRRGVLRQVGAVYQFRHIELQHRLATRDTDKQEAASALPAITATDE
jgi:hypothetical protein